MSAHAAADAFGSDLATVIGIVVLAWLVVVFILAAIANRDDIRSGLDRLADEIDYPELRTEIPRHFPRRGRRRSDRSHLPENGRTAACHRRFQ